MKRLTRFQENISVKKATNYAIIINSLEILLILGVMALVVISRSTTSARAWCGCLSALRRR